MSNPRILVVDDQPINVQLLKRKLERGGLDVSTANNGLEALEQVKAHKPDLILLDPHDARHGRHRGCASGLQVRAARRARFRSSSSRRAQRRKASWRASPSGLSTTSRSRDRPRRDGGPGDHPASLCGNQPGESRAPAPSRGVAPRRHDRRQLAQGIAHNLNNLLGVVIGYLDLIKTGYDKPPVVKKNAQNVDDAIQRIVGIVRQLSTLWS